MNNNKNDNNNLNHDFSTIFDVNEIDTGKTIKNIVDNIDININQFDAENKYFEFRFWFVKNEIEKLSKIFSSLDPDSLDIIFKNNILIFKCSRDHINFYYYFFLGETSLVKIIKNNFQSFQISLSAKFFSQIISLIVKFGQISIKQPKKSLNKIANFILEENDLYVEFEVEINNASNIILPSIENLENNYFVKISYNIIDLLRKNVNKKFYFNLKAFNYYTEDNLEGIGEMFGIIEKYKNLVIVNKNRVLKYIQEVLKRKDVSEGNFVKYFLAVIPTLIGEKVLNYLKRDENFQYFNILPNNNNNFNDNDDDDYNRGELDSIQYNYIISKNRNGKISEAIVLGTEIQTYLLIPFNFAIKRNNNKYEYIKYINDNCQINLINECNIKIESDYFNSNINDSSNINNKKHSLYSMNDIKLEDNEIENLINDNFNDEDEKEEEKYFEKKESPIKKEKNYNNYEIKNPFD
jgi:hypothetical protein